MGFPGDIVGGLGKIASVAVAPVRMLGAPVDVVVNMANGCGIGNSLKSGAIQFGSMGFAKGDCPSIADAPLEAAGFGTRSGPSMTFGGFTVKEQFEFGSKALKACKARERDGVKETRIMVALKSGKTRAVTCEDEQPGAFADGTKTALLISGAALTGFFVWRFVL